MSAWKLNRIKIEGFKAFECLEERYDSDLIVYDGPNGFGKTSLFDAKQVLFTGILPRIKAKVNAIKWGASKPKQSLFQHFGYSKDVIILAEFVMGSSKLTVMRKASAADGKTSNKPENTDYFKLFEVEDYDNPEPLEPVQNEPRFWEKYFGENFLKNFTVLHYLPQDHSPLLLPDATVDNQKRTSQIEHLFNLDEMTIKVNRCEKIVNETKEQKTSWEKERVRLSNELNGFKISDSTEVETPVYTSILPDGSPLQWDKETPFQAPDLAVLNQANSDLEHIALLVNQRDEVSKRDKNQKIKNSVEQDNFRLSILLGHHVDRFDDLQKSRDTLSLLKSRLNAVSKPLEEIAQEDYPLIQKANEEKYQQIKFYFEEISKLTEKQKTDDKALNALLSARKKLASLIANEQTDCPLCGFDYKEHEALEESVTARTQIIQRQLGEQGMKIQDLSQKLGVELGQIKKSLENKVATIEQHYNADLLKELEVNQDKFGKFRNILERLNLRGISVSSKYSTDEAIREKQVTDIKTALLAQLEPDNEELTEEAYSFFKTYFKSPESLDSLTAQSIDSKKRYINNKFNELSNSIYSKKQNEANLLERKIQASEKLLGSLGKISNALNKAKNQYINQTVGQIESLFHIYSGRLLLNYQCGLGVFIEMPTTGAQKSSTMRFVAPRLNKHDATLSMSSGQTSALSLALFLALNKRYAEAKFVFVDDPTQCMDEINVASLSDLLRVELRDKQVVISTHEQEISNYLTYRYEKAGLNSKSINLLQRTRQAMDGDAAEAG